MRARSGVVPDGEQASDEEQVPEPDPSPSASETPSPSPSAPAEESREDSEDGIEEDDVGEVDLTDSDVEVECPSAVTGVVAIGGVNAVELSWTAGDDAAELLGFFVHVTGAGTDRWSRVVAPESSLSVLGLRNGVEYSFEVFAVSEAGSSAGSAVVRAIPSTGVEGVVGGLIVEFAPNVQSGTDSGVVPGAERVSDVELSIAGNASDTAMLVELSEPVDLATAEQIASDLAADDRVEWAEPDQFFFTSAVSESTGAWNLTGDYGVDAFDDDGQSRDSEGAGVTVAVIDTGITPHPDLDGRLASGYDFVSNPESLASSRQPNAPPVAFDGDYVDTGSFGALGRDADPTDPGDWREVSPVRNSSWHGTSMAGVIATVAPGAKIQPVRALSWRGGLLSDIAASITWASGGSVNGVPSNTNPSKVLSMSFAVETPCPAALQQAIDGASERGSILIAAAGNANDDAAKYAPGNCNGVITVGATNAAGTRADYSNFGDTIDISAPGGDAANPVTATSNTGTQNPDQPATSTVFGTSTATAHVAAAAAILTARETTSTPAEAFTTLTGRAFTKDFATPTCEPGDPTITCGAGILSLAQIASAATDCAPFATGGTVTKIVDAGKTYCVHSFTSVGSSNFTVVKDGGLDVEYLIVAGGGGGGGGYQGGGGGAGGMVEDTTRVSAQTYEVVVGAGGIGGIGGWTSGENSPPFNGEDSSISGLSTASGGGLGASEFRAGNNSAGNGGSGGGGTWRGHASLSSGGTGIEGQGFAGGDGLGLPSNQNGGGGGGAGSVGSTPVGVDTPNSHPGGAGRTSAISGSSTVYSTGGDGVRRVTLVTGADGTPNSGDGGGGGSTLSGQGVGGSGGSGVVIIRYLPRGIVIEAGNNQSAAVGTAVAVAPSVLVSDVNGNPDAGVSVTFAVASGDGSVTGAVATTDASGIATVGSWTLGASAGTNTLTAMITGSDPAIATTFTATGIGAASQLAFTTQPVGGASGAVLGAQPVIEIRDVQGNLVTTDNATDVTVTIGSGAGGTLGGTQTVRAVGGVVTFTNLTLAGAVGVDYVLRFTAGALAVDSNNVTVTTGAATALSITVQPSGTAANGVVFVQQPVIQLRDSAGNAVAQSGVVVTAVIASGDETLGGTVTATTNAGGVATFSGLKITGLVGVRTLGFTATDLIPVTSGNVSITAGAASQLAFTTQPSASAVAGVAFATQPVVTIQDAQGNTITESSAEVVLTLTTGTGVLAGTARMNAVNGVADFAGQGLNINLVGTNKVLTATAGALTAATSDAFAITPGAISVAGTGSRLSGTNLSRVADGVQAATIEVQLRDVSGNNISTEGVVVTFATTRGTLNSFTAATNGSGVASVMLTSATSGAADVTASITTPATGAVTNGSPVTVTFTVGTASQLVITTQPVGGASGAVLAQQPVIQIRDVQGNLVTTDNATDVSVAIGSGVGGTLGGTQTVRTVGGVATFTNLTLAGTVGVDYVLRFTSEPELTAVDSGNVTVTGGAATQIAVQAGNNQSAAVGAAVGVTPSVLVRDGNNNPVASVSVTFVVASGGGSVTGAVATTNASGIATVGSWTLGGVAGANTLTATITGSDPVVLVTFTATATGGGAGLPSSGGGGIGAVMPDGPVLPPASVLSGSVPGAVLVGGVLRTDVVLTEDSTGSGWEFAGPDFSMILNAQKGNGDPDSLLSSSSMRLPQDGSIAIGGSGYSPDSEVAVFLIPVTGPRSIGKMMARSMGNAVSLGSIGVSSGGVLSSQLTLPTGMAAGSYVLQINGLSTTNELLSVNLRLVVVPAIVMKAGFVREAAFYQGRSAELSRVGRAKLLNMVAAIPKDASDVRVNIVGVSTSLSTTSQNLTLARDRAEEIATFLADQGVMGEYTVSVSTTFTVRDAERSTRTLNGNASPTPLDQPLTSSTDKQLTTAAISFTAPV